MFKNGQEVWVDSGTKRFEGIVTGIQEKLGFRGTYPYQVIYIKLSTGEEIKANEWTVYPKNRE